MVAPLEDGYNDYGYTSTTVYTTYGHPPPPRVEYRYAAPSPSHIWIGGDWFWAGSRYDWRPGYWAPPGYRPVPRPPHLGYAHPRPCGRCRPCPAAHRYARMSSRAHRIGVPKGGSHPRCALNGPCPGADRRQILPSYPSQPGMERPERPRPPHIRPDEGERPRPDMRPDRPRPEARPAWRSDAEESRRPFPRRERDRRDE
nr:hypothetical protein [Comamonas jiangduensis]